MALTQTQQTVVDYLTLNPDAISVTFGADTKTLTEWYLLDTTAGDTVVADTLNNQSIGAEHAKTVQRAAIDGNDLVEGIAASAEFASMQPATLAQLSFLVSRGSFRATPNALLALDKALTPFVTAKAALLSLKTRPSSIYEALTGIDGAIIDHSAVFGLRHPT